MTSVSQAWYVPLALQLESSSQRGELLSALVTSPNLMHAISTDNNSPSNPNLNLTGILTAGGGRAQDDAGIVWKSFVVNIAVSLALFAFQLSAFFLLKSSAIGRRIYQPKTYLVQDRLRVETVPTNPVRWIRRICTIRDEEFMIKCGLDGYFFIRFLRAILVIFVPLMAVIVTILLPFNYKGGAGTVHYLDKNGQNRTGNITGLDQLSWQNVQNTKTERYWAHLVCAIMVISWTLYRIYREKVNFIDVRQRFLTSPEQRLKASAKTVLITNIPNEYRSKEALEALYDVFVDNDDRSRLTVWVNRDYGTLRNLVARRRSLRHALEKAELKIQRLVNKKYQKTRELSVTASNGGTEKTMQHAPGLDDEDEAHTEHIERTISSAYEKDCHDEAQLWHRYLKSSTSPTISLLQGKDGKWKPASSLKIWASGKKKVPKIAWLRTEIAHLTVEIESFLPRLDDEEHFKKQNSAFIQFDRQMAAHMACSLVSHNKAGRMSPRYLGVAPHEIIWSNMGVTSLGRFVRSCIALVLFAAILFLWGIPTIVFSSMYKIATLRQEAAFLHWLRPWPSWIMSLISGPLTAILLALLIQLLIPALLRKLAVLMGAPTRSKREIITQNFYFTFLFIELVLVSSISSGVFTVLPRLVRNPGNIPNLLASNLPRSSNYFFNYLIIQSVGFSGSILFQYLRVLYITTIWPWFTQTPREEAWLQTTIPHQMWGNVHGLFTNFAVIGLIFCIISPLMLIFISITFSLFWVAYRHNYYYVQRNKVDTHGLLFNNALSQLFAGVYVMEMALIGLFFLIRDQHNNVACKAQAIVMIVVLILTAVFHFVMEQHLRPLYEFLPVALEDSAVDAERQRFLIANDNHSSHEESGHSDEIELTEFRSVDALDGGVASRGQTKSMSTTAAQARKALLKIKRETTERVADIQAHLPEPIDKSRRREVADQLAAAIAGYPDELTDLTPEEREAQLKAAFQDPITREPAPVIWLPQDPAGISEDAIKQSKKYGKYLQYSNAGSFLTKEGKCEIIQPAPDVRPDWLLDWVL